VAAVAANLAQRWALSRHSVELAGMIASRCLQRGVAYARQTSRCPRACALSAMNSR
jgi:hypothetical protein